MKKCALIVAVAGMASALQAAPIESVTFTNVNSIGRQGNALNEIRTATFTSTGLVSNITVTGSLSAAAGITNTWSSQAMILCTPPGGAPAFIIQPFTSRTNMTTAQAVPAGAFTQPLGSTPYAPSVPMAANSGVWTFQFFESSWEGLATSVPDAVWSTLTLTLDDAAPTLLDLPVFVDRSIEFSFNNVPCDIPWNAAIDTHPFVTFTPTQSTVVDTVVVSGIATGTSLDGAANVFGINVGNTQYNYTPVYAMLVRVKPPVHPTLGGGFRTNRYAVNAVGSASSSKLQWSPVGITAVDTTVEPAGSVNPAIPANTGEWKVEFLSNLSSATTAAFKSAWNTVRVDLVSGTPPASTETVTLVHGTSVDKTGTFAGAGQTKWYKIHIGATAISRTTGTALDLGMVGTNLAPQNDACMAMYNSGGAVIATSFNSGPGSLPQISFGQGIRNPVGDGIPFDGGNPNRSPSAAGGNYRPDLTANTDYYIVVANGDDGLVFNAGLFSVTPTTEQNEGPFTVNFRSWLDTNTAPFDTPNATDLGNLASAPPTISGVATMTDATRFRWFKFTINEDANDTTGKFVDIDTAGTLDPINDTNIALYDSNGNLKSLNDDMAPGWGADNPTGGNSAMSFGSSNNGNGRDYTAINPNIPLASGQDGTLAAGTYYFQVSLCCASYANDRFWVINDYATGLDNGDIAFAVRNNYGAPCGPADIGSAGGNPGTDGHLDNNDFIAFITYFFNQDPIADMGVAGGLPGHDSLWDNNDFIAFISYFFSGPSSCQ